MSIAGKLSVDEIEQFAQAIRRAKRVMPSMRIAQIVMACAADPYYLADSELTHAIHNYTSQHEQKTRRK